jgi:iron complex outermembrane receptor protein
MMRKEGSLLAACVIAAVSGSSVAMAQTPPQARPEASAESASSSELQEIIVTGSRIVRTDFVATSPIITASEATLRETGKVNVESALQQLPQFVPGRDENDNAEASGGGGRATVNLRGLGETRTLVLLDGRRLPPSNGQMVVDLNTVPMGIVESVEVISGGASAVYGSDAIAGVVNIKTKQHFNGLELNVNGGETFRGDGRRYDVSLTGGFDFADDKGSALVSINYTDRGEVSSRNREFFRWGGPSGTLPQGGFNPTSGNLPSQAAIDAYFATYGAAPGTVRNTAVLGFNDDGTLFTMVNPVLNYRGPREEGGYTFDTGQIIYNTTRDALITVPQERYSLFSKVNYDLTDSVSVYVQGLFTNSEVDTQIGFTPVGANINTVPITNPFIPNDLRAILATRPDPNADFTFNKRYMFSPRRWRESFDTYQIVAGIKGDLPISDWSWDIYTLRNSSRLTETQLDYISRTRIQTLLQAPDGGASICAGGFNPFQGLALNFSAECMAYVSQDLHTTMHVESEITEAAVQGGLFELPAGQLRFSAVANYQANKFDYSPDTILINGDLGGTGNTAASEGSTNVKEIGAELLVPLLKDVPAVEALNLTVAGRRSDYNISGGVNTYKADIDWRPVRSLLIRGGYERAVRAPNMTELFSAPTGVTTLIGSVPQAGDPCDVRGIVRAGPNAAQVRALCLAQGIPADMVDSYTYTAGSVGTLVTGSLALKPEKADTYTIGAVFTPRFDSPLFSRFAWSIDYYTISLEDAISSTGAQTAISKCYNLDGTNPSYDPGNLYCGLIDRTFNGPGSLRIYQPFLNLGGYKTSGIDSQIDWAIDLGMLGLGDNAGELRFNTALTYVEKFEIQQLPGDPFLDYASTVSLPLSAVPTVPKFRALTTLGYQVGPMNVGLRWRHVSSMDDVTVVTRPQSPARGVPAYNLFDLLLGYRVSDGISINAQVTNLGDKDPPVVAESPGNTNRGLYDVLGRAFLVSFQLKLQ